MTTVAGIFISAPHDGQIYVAERSRCHSGLGTFALYGIGQRLPNNRGYEYHALAAVQAFPEGGCETRWGSVRPHKPRLDLYGRQPRRMGWPHAIYGFVQNKAQALLDVNFYNVCDDHH
jgi:hypothetical protein